MALDEANPTLDELRALDLPQILARAPSASSFRYAQEFIDPRTMPARGTPEWRARVLLGFVTGLRLDADDDAEPFKIGGWFGQARVTDLSADQIAVLKGWLPEIFDAELHARVADVLWCAVRPRDHHHGRMAVASYVLSARRLATPEQYWCAAVENLRRALVLARKFDLVADVVGCIAEIVGDEQQSCEGPRDARLLRLLLETGHDEPSRLAAIADARAAANLLAGEGEQWGTVQFAIAREYLDVAADWYARGDPASERARDARIRAAHAYVLEADKALEAGRRHEEASLVGKAVTRLRRLAKPPDGQIDALTTRMVAAQRSAPWADFSATLDFTQEYLAGRRWVRGQEFPRALLRLAYVAPTPEVSRLRDMAREHFDSSVVTRLFAVALFSPERLVRKHVPAFQDGENENEAAMRSQMWQQCSALHAQAFACVEGARQELLLEHSPTLADILPLVRDSWLVPQGHELLFARGLLAGLFGDFIVACHILIPQFENGLRNLVEQVTRRPLVTYGDDGLQSVGLLNKILSTPELADEIGVDLVFDLQGLLVRPEGADLRNRLAHGFLGDRGFRSIEVGYFWWVCLRLVIWLLPSVRSTRVDDTPHEASSPSPPKWSGGAALVIDAALKATTKRRSD